MEDYKINHLIQLNGGRSSMNFTDEFYCVRVLVSNFVNVKSCDVKNYGLTRTELEEIRRMLNNLVYFDDTFEPFYEQYYFN